MLPCARNYAPQVNPGVIKRRHRQRQQLEPSGSTAKAPRAPRVGGERERNPAAKPADPNSSCQGQFGLSKVITPEELDEIARNIRHDVRFATLSNRGRYQRGVFAERGIGTGIATLPEHTPMADRSHQLTEGRLQ